MNVLIDSAFNRLLSKYERTFGEPPPFTAATADEVIDYMRRRLYDAMNAGTLDDPGPPAWLTPAARTANGRTFSPH